MSRTLHGVLLVLLAFIGGAAWPAAAAGEPGGQSVRASADHARRLVGQMLADDLRGRGDSAERQELQRLHEAISAGHLIMTERLRLRGDTLQGASARFGERHRVATARYETAVSRTLAGFARVTALLQSDKAALEELQAALVNLAPPRRPAIHGVLPYHQPSFLPQSPVATPQITPAYRLAALAPPAAADLACTQAAPGNPGQIGRIAAGCLREVSRRSVLRPAACRVQRAGSGGRLDQFHLLHQPVGGAGTGIHSFRRVAV